MDERKTVLVLESEKLLAAGIVSMLDFRPEFNLAKTTAVSLIALEQPADMYPDVVIMDEELLADNLLAVVKLTNCYPKLRLIVFNTDNNDVLVFDKRTVDINSGCDFLHLLSNPPDR